MVKKKEKDDEFKIKYITKLIEKNTKEIVNWRW